MEFLCPHIRRENTGERLSFALEISVPIQQGQPQVNCYLSTGNKCQHITRATTESRATSLSVNSVSVYNKGNHRNNGYQSHRKSLPKYINCKHRSMVTIPTGNQCPHITRATRASTAIRLTGKQYPHLKRASKVQWLSVSLEISVHI